MYFVYVASKCVLQIYILGRFLALLKSLIFKTLCTSTYYVHLQSNISSLTLVFLFLNLRLSIFFKSAAVAETFKMFETTC